MACERTRPAGAGLGGGGGATSQGLGAPLEARKGKGTGSSREPPAATSPALTLILAQRDPRWMLTYGTVGS